MVGRGRIIFFPQRRHRDSKQSSSRHCRRIVLGWDSTVTYDGTWVLLVDDASDDLNLYFEALSRQRLNVVTASNGSQALEKALTCLPEAIVIDVILPGID